MSLVIYIGNTTVIELVALTNSTTDTAITDATVTVTLVDKRLKQSVSGQSWPLSMTHVSGGTYRGTIENDVVISDQREYEAVVTATASGVGAATWRPRVNALVRAE